MGARRLVPLGKVDEILHSSLSPQEKTALIANYLDEHETIGLGDPARFYVFAPFNVVRQILADFVAEAINLNGPFRSELDFQTELYSRHLAYGYVHRVAEELVSGGLPVDWKATEGTAEKLAKDEMRPPDSIPPWAEFCGKGNSRFILYEKANVVTSLVEMVWDSGLILAATTDDQIRLTEEHARCVFSETAILFIRVLDEIAFGALGAAVSEEFMEAFVECVGQALEGRGVHPERFAEVLSPRIAEYSRYTKWIPAKRESSRGTLFWEFGKKVADDFGIVKSAVFNLLLTNVLMGSLVEWRLVELLRGVAS
jgi:tetrahydromethanopterin S-methyltransferase subunit G